MATRNRTMALDGHSVEADALADHSTRAKVQVVIIAILNDLGPCTDDTIVEQYAARASRYPGIPKVTPQRIRTARSDLNHRGLVRAASEPGLSQYGNKATRWAIA